MHTLSNYNDTGILIVTPEADLSADRQARNANFKNIATGYVPYTGATGDVDLGAHTVKAGVLKLDTDQTTLGPPLPGTFLGSNYLYRDPGFLPYGSTARSFAFTIVSTATTGSNTILAYGSFSALQWLALTNSLGTGATPNLETYANDSTYFAPLNDGSPHTLVVTISAAAVVNFYLDGALKDTETLTALDTLFNPGTPFTIGVGNDLSSITYLTGVLSNVAVWASELSPADALAISGGTSPSGYAPLGFWPLAGDLTDHSGNGYDLTAGGISGSAICSQPMQGAAYKKVVIHCDGLTGTVDYTFPAPFTYTPAVTQSAGLSLSPSTTDLSITGSGTTGFIILEGF